MLCCVVLCSVVLCHVLLCCCMYLIRDVQRLRDVVIATALSWPIAFLSPIDALSSLCFVVLTAYV